MTQLDRNLSESFVDRHIGPRENEVDEMLKLLGFQTLDELTAKCVPAQIRSKGPLQLEAPLSEAELLLKLKAMASENKVFRSMIGTGYSDTFTPGVILRNILENPGWYTQYTPYQAEISQGRLEALLNFQTMIIDLTGLEIANASLLDEGTAAAEAMALCFNLKDRDTNRAFFVSELCHPQTIDVVRTRAKPLGIEVVVGDHRKLDFKAGRNWMGVLLQYPATDGSVFDYRATIDQAHGADALAVVAADILSLTLLATPGELGADIAVGSTQRFGVPLGFGGPHAAYIATRDAYKRQLPGRIVGLSQDVDGRPAIRLALQTREQHIRRDKATSNICTAQVLLAVMASMYAVYHGPKGLKRIATKVHLLASVLREGLKNLGYETGSAPHFDTLTIALSTTLRHSIIAASQTQEINFGILDPKKISIALDETTTLEEIQRVVALFAHAAGKQLPPDAAKKLWEARLAGPALELPAPLLRKSAFLTHPVFNTHHSETEMLRYIHRLQNKDLSLTASMIPLGSCTMKLNATTEMIPVTWPEFSRLHPFAPMEQTQGYRKMLHSLEKMLCELTGFDAVSLQPNAGSQGEYAGLLVIRKYQESRGQAHRDICLIPRSAHGTNPASAALAGMKVVVVDCDSDGNVDLGDLKAKAEEHKNGLSALMVTYPSTHGVFEESIRELCEVVHKNGGQVYMDGANMNAQIGLCRPGEFGPDVCHLNLHKTFCIPHGGGGPGMGPIGVKVHLAPYLPSHPVVATGGKQGIGAISAAPWGSASILPISWVYIALMGGEGLKRATEVAILSANYIAKRLEKHYPVLYRGKEGLVAHECIFDVRQIKEKTGIDVEDIAKRLMDYGFHAPTMSFPVPGTLMVEPTESEPKRELDRFCDAMIAIRAEITEIETGKGDRANNVLKNAPHTALQLARTEWNHPYSREQAAFPSPTTREWKFWPAVGRINNVLGDRTLICACSSIDEFT